MQYWKIVDENSIVKSISTVNTDGQGNSHKGEYEQIKLLLQNMQKGKCLVDNGNNTYKYIDKMPEPEEDEIDESEALEILLGGSTI